MSRTRSRRSLLRTTAGIGTAVGIAGLAGCSSVPFLGGDGSSSPRNWLYDPTAYPGSDEGIVQFRAPAEIDAHDEYLNPQVKGSSLFDWLGRTPERDSVDWKVQMFGGAYPGPVQTVYSGSFGKDAAREAVVDGFDGDVAVSEGEDVGNLETVVGGGNDGAYRNGLAVNVSSGSVETFRGLLNDARTDEDRLRDATDGTAAFLDQLYFDHATYVDIGRIDDRWTARGTAYRIDGETTTAHLVLLNDGRGDRWGSVDLRAFGDGLDELDGVTVGQDGPVRWLEGTAATKDLRLNGAVFHRT